MFVSQLSSLWLDGMIYIKSNPDCDCGVDPFVVNSSIQDDLLTYVKEHVCSILSGLLEFSPVLLRYFISGTVSMIRVRSFPYTVVL